MLFFWLRIFSFLSLFFIVFKSNDSITVTAFSNVVFSPTGPRNSRHTRLISSFDVGCKDSQYGRRLRYMRLSNRKRLHLLRRLRELTDEEDTTSLSSSRDSATATKNNNISEVSNSFSFLFNSITNKNLHHLFDAVTSRSNGNEKCEDNRGNDATEKPYRTKIVKMTSDDIPAIVKLISDEFLEETPDLFSVQPNSRPLTKTNFATFEEGDVFNNLQTFYKSTFVNLYNEYERTRFAWAFQDRLKYTNPFDHRVFLLYELRGGETPEKQSTLTQNYNLVGMIELSFQPIFGRQVPSRLTATSYLKKIFLSRMGFPIRPYISNLLIKETARKKGYGTALVLQCEEYVQNLLKQYQSASPESPLKSKNYIYMSNGKSEDQSGVQCDSINVYLHAEANYLPARKLYRNLKYSEVGKGVKFGSEVIKFEKQLRNI